MQVERIPVGEGVPIGIEKVTNPAIGIGGAYGTWGESVDNAGLPNMLERMLGEALTDGEKFNLAELGFLHRQFTPTLSRRRMSSSKCRWASASSLQPRMPAAGNQLRSRQYWSVPADQWLTTMLRGSVRPAGHPGGSAQGEHPQSLRWFGGWFEPGAQPIPAGTKTIGKNLAKELNGKKVLLGGIEG